MFLSKSLKTSLSIRNFISFILASILDMLIESPKVCAILLALKYSISAFLLSEMLL